MKNIKQLFNKKGATGSKKVFKRKEKDVDIKFTGCRRISSDKKPASIFDVIITIFLVGSCLYTYLTCYGIPVIHYILGPAVLANIVIFSILNLKLKRKAKIITFYSLAAALIIAGVLIMDILYNGGLFLVNRMIGAVNDSLNTTIYDYVVETAETNEAMYITILLTYVLMFLAPCLYICVKRKYRIAVTLITAAVALNGYFFMLEGSVIPLFIYLVSIVGFNALSYKMFRFGNSKNGKFRTERTSRNSRVSFILMSFVSLAVICVLFGTSVLLSNEKPAILTSVEEICDSVSYFIRYGDDRNLKDGSFSNIDERTVSDKRVLKITNASSDGPLYLKGFTGADYTSKGWQELDRQAYHDNFGLFAYMETNEFSPVTQIAAYMEQTGAGETSELTIENISGIRKYVYVPYGVRSILDGSAEYFYDENVVSNGLFGQKNYTVAYYPSAAQGNMVNIASHTSQRTEEMTIGDGSEGLNYFELSRDNDANYNYMELEQNYRSFVYEYYLTVPEELLSEVGLAVDSAMQNESRDMTYDDVIRAVRRYFLENTEYSDMPVGEETADSQESNDDVVTSILTTGASGHSKHYATAAVLMLRSKGIPARYVEGYYLSDEDINNSTVEDGERVTYATEGNAHSWVEVYDDGYGWIPVEVTPGYFDSRLAYIGSHGYDDDMFDDDDNNGVIEDFEDGTEQNETDSTDGNAGRIVLIVFVSVIGAAIAGLLLWLLIIRLVRNKRFSNINYNFAVISIYNYILSLVQFDTGKLPGNIVDNKTEELVKRYGEFSYGQFDEIYQLGAKAKFSKYGMTEEDKNVMLQFAKHMYATVMKKYKSKKFPGNLKQIAVMFLYKV